MRTVLAESASLETPNDFVQALLQKLKPREGRSLNADIIQASVDFQQFFESLGVNTSGHTQTNAKTERVEEAVHCFSFPS